MNINVNELDPAYDFAVTGASYIGAPRANTVMYISGKVEHLLRNLSSVADCLVFAEDSITVPDELRKKHCFVMTPNPQAAYAGFLCRETAKEDEEDRQKRYTRTEGGYYVGENVRIGENARIEPGVLLGHDVVIGRDAVILAGAVIKHAVIGDHFYCNENAVVGENGFVMAEDREGNKFRVPTIGKVVIGDHVEIGAMDGICRGSAGDTVIEDHAKLSALIQIAHDAHIGKNAEITGGCAVGGFAVIGEHSFLGLRAAVKNRVTIGRNCTVGMGAVVIRDVADGLTVCGNPAKPLNKE